MRGISKWENNVVEICNSSNLFDGMYFNDLSREETRDIVNKQFMYVGKQMLARGFADPKEIRKNIEGYAVDLTISGAQQVALAVKFAVHYGLYAKTLAALGTEKHEELIQRAIRLDDLGCFMMTELSHGSNVQSCKTTATFDTLSQQFVFNTPSHADVKFWIGNASKTAHLAIVFAQLITKGKKHGVHAFVIPIRDR